MKVRILHQNNRKKLIQVLLSIAFLVIILYVAASFYVTSKIRTAVEDDPDIELLDFSVHLWSGSMDIDSLKYHKVIEGSKEVNMSLVGTRVQGVGYWDYLTKGSIHIDGIYVDNTSLAINTYREVSVIEPDTLPKKENFIKEIIVGEVILKSGYIDYDTDGKRIQLLLNNATVSDLEMHADTSYIIGWSDLRLSAENFLYDDNQAHHILRIKDIEINDQVLRVDSLELIPKRTKENFNLPLEYRKTRIELFINHIDIYGMDLLRMVSEQSIVIEKIVSHSGSLSLYNDRNKAGCPDCIKKYFHEMFHEVDMPIKVDTIAIKDSRIELQQIDEGDSMEVKLFWNHVYATLYGVDNNAKNPNNVVVDLQAKFMNSSTTKIKFELPVTDPNRDYTYKGSLDSMDLKVLNRFLKFSNQFRVDGGHLSSLNFEGRGNLMQSTGEMELRYSGLKLKLLNKDLRPKNLLSGLLNSILGKDNNPSGNKLRIGKIYHERDMHKDFFGNWWLALQSGIKSTTVPNILLSDKLDSKTVKLDK